MHCGQSLFEIRKKLENNTLYQSARKESKTRMPPKKPNNAVDEELEEIKNIVSENKATCHTLPRKKQRFKICRVYLKEHLTKKNTNIVRHTKCKRRK